MRYEFFCQLTYKYQDYKQCVNEWVQSHAHEGRFDFGKNVVHVPHDSPFVLRHHLNWRLRGMHSMGASRERDLYYTAPMSLSRDQRVRLRERLVQMIQKMTKEVAESPSEDLVCLNIDFFEY